MTWLRRPRTALVLLSAVAAFTATACFGAPPPEEPPPQPPPPRSPQACQSVGAASTSAGKQEPARPPSDQPIPPDQAGAQAREVASTTDVRTKNGDIPIVTVEEQGGQPVIQSTPVKTPDQAAAVAEQKAADGDLHAVDVDKPVKSTTVFPIPSDQRFGEQWSFNEVPYVKAWNTDQKQGDGVTVAVVDTGVQQSHPDLGSGQVLTGEYFLHDNNFTQQFSGPGGDTDPNGHGTHVSGIVAAQENSIGISGAAPKSKILPVQVLCGDGSGWASDVAQGITWAVDNGGAKVINLSLGGGYSNAEELAIKHASENGVVVVAAGGNCGQGGKDCNYTPNLASYPAALSVDYPNLIAVAATTNASPPGHALYSTSADYIDISAPGGSAAACSPASACNVLSTVPFSAQEISDPSGYAAIAGTSMATPHVSAAVALLISNGTCTDPAKNVKTRLTATANSALTPTPNDGTPAQQFGAGLVDPNVAGTTC